MFLVLAMWATVAGSEPGPAGDAVNCLWQALPAARRETLVSLPYDPGFEARLKQFWDILIPTEVEGIAARCGAVGIERLPLTYWAVQIAAQRQGAEAALQPYYSVERLDAAFAPVRGDIEDAAQAQDEDDNEPADLGAVFEARFLSSLGGDIDPDAREALHRYAEARAEGVLANLMWLELGKWEALSDNEKARLMEEDAANRD